LPPATLTILSTIFYQRTVLQQRRAVLISAASFYSSAQDRKYFFAIAKFTLFFWREKHYSNTVFKLLQLVMRD
jgi:hypothetical protein